MPLGCLFGAIGPMSIFMVPMWVMAMGDKGLPRDGQGLARGWQGVGKGCIRVARGCIRVAKGLPWGWEGLPHECRRDGKGQPWMLMRVA